VLDDKLQDVREFLLGQAVADGLDKWKVDLLNAKRHNDTQVKRHRTNIPVVLCRNSKTWPHYLQATSLLLIDVKVMATPTGRLRNQNNDFCLTANKLRR
jgi:hypothetical protein